MGVAGLKGYQFKLDDNTGKSVVADWTPVQEETSYTFTQENSGIQQDMTYRASMRAVDWAGNIRNATNNGEEFVEISKVIEVGDYINYDAGEWIASDFSKITSSPGSPKVNKSKNLPTVQGQFGGFIEGQSRNSNSTPWSASLPPRTAGWRVWSIDETTGEVTLISAGHPETYYLVWQKSGNYAKASKNILLNRDYSMYVDTRYATGARVLTGQDAVEWYNKQYGTDYVVVENGGSSTTTFCGQKFPEDEIIDVLENGARYWVASTWNPDNLYCILPDGRVFSCAGYRAFGIRVLIKLKPEVLLDMTKGAGIEKIPYNIAVK